MPRLGNSRPGIGWAPMAPQRRWTISEHARVAQSNDDSTNSTIGGTVLLKAAQSHDWQVADVKAVRRDVETDVNGNARRAKHVVETSEARFSRDDSGIYTEDIKIVAGHCVCGWQRFASTLGIH